jgi:hypothetical protein
LNGTENSPVAKWITDGTSDAFPAGFLHPCPYFGDFKLMNVTLKATNVVPQFLRGSYITTSRYFDREDDNILTVDLKTEFF